MEPEAMENGETARRGDSASFGLYYGRELLTAVRAPADASDATVRRIALESHIRVPLCAPREPYAHASMIVRARVKRYGS
jgi:hypothetical protein